MKYELKKVFAARGGRIVLFLQVVLVLLVSLLAVQSVTFVDAQGHASSGLLEARRLREAKSAWTGYLTEDVFAEVIRQNAAINATPEAQSDDWRENDKAYAKKQGFSDIRDIINCALCDFREYDYYRIDAADPRAAGEIYQLRTTALEKWLASDEAEQLYSEAKRAFFLRQYQRLQTPLYYEDADGWEALLTHSLSVVMVSMLLQGFLVCGIFSCEFQWKSDTIFFSSAKGRREGVRSKILAGLTINTVVYWAVILLYTGLVLGILGAGGGSSPIQASLYGWKSFYHITWRQEYLLTVFGGYIGTLSILTAAMLVSAATKSPLVSSAFPVIVLFLPTFLGRVSSASGALGLLPDQLLQVPYVVRYFNVNELFGEVVPALPILYVLYTALFAGLVPLLYQVYRRAEVN